MKSSSNVEEQKVLQLRNLLAQTGLTKEQLLAQYEIEKQKRLVEKAKQGDFLSYNKLTNTDFKETRHAVHVIGEIQIALDLSVDGRIQVICIHEPPQHGKSYPVTETLPSYYKLMNPDSSILTTAYNADTAENFGTKNRTKLEKYAHLFGHKLSSKSNSKTEFGLEGYDGTCLFTGIEGSITSRKGNLIIIDDPYKNASEAGSEATRKSVESAFDSAIKTRMHPGTILILIMNRWHVDDLSAHVQKTYNNICKVINIQAQCTDKEADPLGREVGEYLWPEHHSEEYYESQKYNQHVWQTQYQQTPELSKGGEFSSKDLNYYEYERVLIPGTQNINLSLFDDILYTVDSASKKGVKNDYTSFWLIGRIQDRYLILDRFKGKVDIVELVDLAIGKFSRYPCDRVIEDRASGTQLIQILENKGYKRIIKGKADVSTGGKEIRAQYMVPILRRGQIYIPQGAEWEAEFGAEMDIFPHGVHDDEIDNLVRGITELDTRYQKQLNTSKAVVTNKPSFL